MGVPYSIEGGNLIIGPYVKDRYTGPPNDYDSRKRVIPCEDIVEFQRLGYSLGINF